MGHTEATGPVPAFDPALRGGSWSCRRNDGARSPLPVARWFGSAPDTADGRFDDAVVARCAGPTIDLGCGPGRFVTALAAVGVAALGVDHSRVAVRLARERGAVALCRSIFDGLPGEGRWHRVLLIDGNVGIAGDPTRVLRRAAEIVSATGSVLVELDPEVEHVAVEVIRLEAGAIVGPWFRWARLGILGAEDIAHRLGMSVAGVWEESGRLVVELIRSQGHGPVLRGAS